MFNPHSRTRRHELMDAPDADADQLRSALRFLRRVNAWLGYNRSTLAHLQRMTADWPAGTTLRVVDIATGSADLPLAIVRWGRKRGFNVRVTGVDLHAFTLQCAHEHVAGRPEADAIELVQADALKLPFADNAFDFATTSLFLHHLDEPQIVQALGQMARVSARGMVVGDLIRNRRAYAWIWLFSLPAARMVRHDARASVAQAFARDEILALAREAGLPWLTWRRHFAHRFTLAGLNPSA